jgi:hypothetical protein
MLRARKEARAEVVHNDEARAEVARTQGVLVLRRPAVHPLAHIFQLGLAQLLGLVDNRRIVHRVDDQALYKNASAFEFSLCLSRGCLGKKMILSIKWLRASDSDTT